MKKVIPVNAKLIPPSAERVFKGKIFDTYQWQQEQFDGSYQTFEMVRRPDTVHVIGVVGDSIMVLDEAQPHYGKRTNFPSGRVDDSDPDILSAAQREVLEETGRTFNTWKLIRVHQPVGKIEWFINTYLATDPAEEVVPTAHEAGEKITEELWSFDKVKAASLDGVRYLDEAAEIFENVNSLDELLTVPEFQGQEVDR